MKRKCLICDLGSLEETEDITLDIGGYVFIVKGHRCTNCKEEFPFEAETKKVIDISKKLYKKIEK